MDGVAYFPRKSFGRVVRARVTWANIPRNMRTVPFGGNKLLLSGRVLVQVRKGPEVRRKNLKNMFVLLFFIEFNIEKGRRPKKTF